MARISQAAGFLSDALAESHQETVPTMSTPVCQGNGAPPENGGSAVRGIDLLQSLLNQAQPLIDRAIQDQKSAEAFSAYYNQQWNDTVTAKGRSDDSLRTAQVTSHVTKEENVIRAQRERDEWRDKYTSSVREKSNIANIKREDLQRIMDERTDFQSRLEQTTRELDDAKEIVGKARTMVFQAVNESNALKKESRALFTAAKELMGAPAVVGFTGGGMGELGVRFDRVREVLRWMEGTERGEGVVPPEQRQEGTDGDPIEIDPR